jgi:hypothetical protein
MLQRGTPSWLPDAAPRRQRPRRPSRTVLSPRGASRSGTSLRFEGQDERTKSLARKRLRVRKPGAEIRWILVREHDGDVALADRRTVEQRAVARAKPDQLRLHVLAGGTTARGKRGGRLLRQMLVRAAPARGPAEGEQGEEARGEPHYIRSGASTPTRSRLSAITVWVARTRASRKASASLSRTRCSW